MVKQDSGFVDSEMMYPPVATNGSHQMIPAGAYGTGNPVIPMPVSGNRGPEILNGPLNQTWLMNCLRRRWLMAVLLGSLAALIAGAALLWLFPVSSQVVAYLQVETEQAQNIFDPAKPVNPKEFEIFQQTQLTLLKSQYVLEAALTPQNIAQLNAVLNQGDDALTWLTDELKVSFPGESKILMLKYEGEENSEEMKKIVDAVIEAYQDEVVATERIGKTEAHANMKKLFQQLNAELKEKVDRKNTLAKELGGADSPTASAELNMLITDVRLLQQRIQDAKKELVDLEVNREVNTRMLQGQSALNATVTEAVEKDPTIQSMRQEQYAMQSQIRSMEALSKRETPEIKRAKASLENLSQQLKEYQMRFEAEMRDRAKHAPNDQMQLVMTEYILRRRHLEQEIVNMQNELEQNKEKITALGSQNGELAMLEAEIEQLNEIAKAMDYKIRAGDIQDSDSREQIKVMQPAFATEQINVYERLAIASLGALAAFCGTCYAVALMEFRRRKLNSPADVDEGLGIRVLGVLPSVSSRKSMAPGSITAAQLSESIDNVRATLMHDSTSRPRQIVLVASPSSMEGSTTVASHLALSLTRAGRRTLLIDGDLRDPALHKLFGMPIEDGLSELVRSEIEISDAIRPTNTEGLWLMTAGVCDMDAIHALATDQLQPIFEKLRAEFDFVIIDGAPVLGLSDSLSIGQHVDGAILTVLRDHSGVRNIHQASELLRGLGIRLIGCVVNGMPFKADRRITRVQRSPGSSAKRLPASSPTEE
jgi:succinoglycan biosynthesis transport protein ExoP